MRSNPTKRIEDYRVTEGRFGSTADFGANGCFAVPHRGVLLRIMASDGTDWHLCGLPSPAWEHVSVSVETRCPTWEEMDYVKRLFWRDDETVLQLHVPRDRHVNFHNYCLHLWKPIGVDVPLPPVETVGPATVAGR